MFEGLFQPMHLLVIVGIALLVFGPKKLPELGKGIGEGIRGFKAAINDEEKPGQHNNNHHCQRLKRDQRVIACKSNSIRYQARLIRNYRHGGKTII
jgi:sec-independent protein translocase protein TatA